jgi:hypothetical protein
MHETHGAEQMLLEASDNTTAAPPPFDIELPRGNKLRPPTGARPILR